MICLKLKEYLSINLKSIKTIKKEVKLFTVINFFLVLTFSPPAFSNLNSEFLLRAFNEIGGGAIVGNGGDTIECYNVDGAEFVGLFTLDYLAEIQQTNSESKISKIHTWEDSKIRIGNILNKISPELALSFKDFATQIMTNSIYGTRKWIPTNLIDIDIKDEEITKLLPSNCYQKKSDGNYPNLRQTVVRTFEPKQIFYRYDEKILNYQKTNNPLQYSFFMVHEWLWDFTSNIKALRRLNWLLHSEVANLIDSEYLNNFFETYDFFNRSLSLCDRSEEIRIEIQKLLLLDDCKLVKKSDLLKIKELKLNSAHLKEFKFLRSGDFGDLFFLETLNLNDQHGLLETLPPYFFRHLGNLKNLDLSNTKSINFPIWITSQLKNLEYLNFSSNPMTRLHNAILAFPKLKILEISIEDVSLFNFYDLYSIKTLKEIRIHGTFLPNDLDFIKQKVPARIKVIFMVP